MIITSPAIGAKVSGIVPVRVDAPGVKQVNFYIDGVLKGRDSSAPFQFDWYTTRYADGPHTVKAVSGNGKQSAMVTVTVANPPMPGPTPTPLPAGTYGSGSYGRGAYGRH